MQNIAQGSGGCIKWLDQDQISCNVLWFWCRDWIPYKVWLAIEVLVISGITSVHCCTWELGKHSLLIQRLMTVQRDVWFLGSLNSSIASPTVAKNPSCKPWIPCFDNVGRSLSSAYQRSIMSILIPRSIELYLILLCAVNPRFSGWYGAVERGGNNSVLTNGNMISDSCPPQLSMIGNHGPVDFFLTSSCNQLSQSANPSKSILPFFGTDT